MDATVHLIVPLIELKLKIRLKFSFLWAFRAYLSRIRANFGEKFDISFYERWKGTLSIEHIRTVSEVVSDICG